MDCLRLYDFYNGVIIFCQRVRVKKKEERSYWGGAELRNYKAPFFKTKTPCSPPATRCSTSPKYLQFSSSLHGEYDKEP